MSHDPHKSALPAAERASLASRAAIASVAMASTLLGLKIWASISTGSVSVLGSLADTALDIIASLVTLYSVRLAHEPSDADHGFGHGKAEALSALFQTWLIALSAIGIAWRAISRLGSGAAPEHPTLGIAVSVFAIAATFCLIWYQRRIVRQTGSIAISADSAHYSSDLMLNGSVIVALVLDAILGLRGADAVFGVAIAVWLVWHAWGVAVHAVDQLMDREWPEEKRQRFLAVAQAHPELRGIHDFRTRSSGARDFVQFHVWVDAEMTVAQAHRVMDEVEEKLMAEFPNTEVIIHPDPDGHPAEERPA
ncbi:MAG: cation diffusion facilitator family transporter [Chakrabartia sp.]